MAKQKEVYSDAELIVLWQDGDAHAFEIIYKRHALKLLAIALQKTGDKAIAQEIVNDAFITLFKNKATAGNVTSLFAYLYIVLKNKVLDWHRRSLNHKKYEEYSAYTTTEADYSTQYWIETRELEKRIKDEIEKLPLQCRNVFKLSREKHLTNKEIAARLKISENTVEQHMRKALRILRMRFPDYGKIIVLILLKF